MSVRGGLLRLALQWCELWSLPLLLAGLAPYSGETDIFIRPGYQFTVVDAMITNFHLPESSLLMLVSAFHGTKSILDAYKYAVARKFRFFSYGDAMFLERAS